MTDRRLPRRRCGRRDAARAHFAQLQATVNDADSGCTRCGELFSDGGTVEVVILRDGTMTAARLAHPECARSGVYAFPGLRAIQAELLTDGLDITTTVGRRAGRRPHALVLIELMTHLSMVPPGTDITDVSDPLADYAATLGLEPISGRLDQITPTSTTTSRLHVEADTLWLIHPDGQDIILDQTPTPSRPGRRLPQTDQATAIVITARGLGLTQQPTTITEAIATRPAWAAQVTITGFPNPAAHAGGVEASVGLCGIRPHDRP